jgi:chitinase
MMPSRYLFTIVPIILFLLLSLVQAERHHHHHSHPHHSSRSLENVTGQSNNVLGRQLGEARCDANNECADKSCCNGVSGYCGRDPEHCQTGICLSNCQAKAECGVGAEVPDATCPLNVCCSKSGYCGTSHNFCAVDLGCQSKCEQPGSTGGTAGDVRDLVIG